jgi:topoisomerase-4 subunit B
MGDGSSPDDGIYILLKEVLDNCIDEFVMGAGKTIEVTIRDKRLTLEITVVEFLLGKSLT